VIVPRSAPFDALSAGALATKPPFDAVALEELTARRPFVETIVVRLVGGVVVEVVAVIVFAVVAVVVVVTGVIGGASATSVVVTVVVDEVVTGCVATGRAGGELFDALNVNTSTKSRIGLDHITHCVFLSEWRSLMEVLEGRLVG
jgi:hypothetical protein